MVHYQSSWHTPQKATQIFLKKETERRGRGSKGEEGKGEKKILKWEGKIHTANMMSYSSMNSCPRVMISSMSRSIDLKTNNEF